MSKLVFLALLGGAVATQGTAGTCADQTSKSDCQFTYELLGGDSMNMMAQCLWDADNSACSAGTVMTIANSQTQTWLDDNNGGGVWSDLIGRDSGIENAQQVAYETLHLLLTDLQSSEQTFAEYMETDTQDCIQEERKARADLKILVNELSDAQASYNKALAEQTALAERIASNDEKLTAMGACVEKETYADSITATQHETFTEMTGAVEGDGMGCRFLHDGNFPTSDPTDYTTCVNVTDGANDEAYDYDDLCEWAVTREADKVCKQTPSQAGVLAKLLAHILPEIANKQLANIVLDVKTRQEAEADWKDMNALIEYNECLIQLKQEQKEHFVLAQDRMRLNEQKTLIVDPDVVFYADEVTRLEGEVATKQQMINGNVGAGEDGELYNVVDDENTAMNEEEGLATHCTKEREANRLIKENIEAELHLLKEAMEFLHMEVNMVGAASGGASLIQEKSKIHEEVAKHNEVTAAFKPTPPMAHLPHIQMLQMSLEDHARSSEVTATTTFDPQNGYEHFTGDFSTVSDCKASVANPDGSRDAPGLTDNMKLSLQALIDAAQAEMDMQELNLVKKDAEIDGDRTNAIDEAQAALTNHREELTKYMATHDAGAAEYNRQLGLAVKTKDGFCTVKEIFNKLQNLHDPNEYATYTTDAATAAGDVNLSAMDNLFDTGATSLISQVTAICNGSEVDRLKALVSDLDNLRAEAMAEYNNRINDAQAAHLTAKEAMLLAMQMRAQINGMYNYAKRALLKAQTEMTHFYNLCLQKDAAATGYVYALDKYPEGEKQGNENFGDPLAASLIPKEEAPPQPLRIEWRNAFKHVAFYAGSDTDHNGPNWPETAADWAALSFSEPAAWTSEMGGGTTSNPLVGLDLAGQIGALGGMTPPAQDPAGFISTWR